MQTEKIPQQIVTESQTKPSILKVRSRFIKTTPDKLRYVAKLVLGKELNEAITVLSFIPTAARIPLISVLKSAISEANDKNVSLPLYIKAIAVDEGPKLKRRRIVQQGRATSILKRMSHLTVYLSNTPKPKFKAKRSKVAEGSK